MLLPWMVSPSPDGSLRTTSARAAFLPHLQTIYCNWWDAEEPRNSSGGWRVASGEKKDRAPGRAGINSARPLQKTGGEPRNSREGSKTKSRAMRKSKSAPWNGTVRRPTVMIGGFQSKGNFPSVPRHPYGREGEGLHLPPVPEALNRACPRHGKSWTDRTFSDVQVISIVWP